MIYDKNYIGALAKKEGFVRDVLEKVIRLSEILSFFENDNLLSNRLALKGGTAINLFCLPSLPRLSIDIDVDYCGTSKEVMLQERGEIQNTVNKYMLANGYENNVKSKRTFSLDSNVYSFTNSGGTRDVIKIEINYSQRCHLVHPQKKKNETLGVLKEAEISTLLPEEIYASKIVALLSRTATRDLYDLNNIISLNNFDREIVRKGVVFYTALNGDAAKEVDLECVEKIKQNDVFRDLVPYLRKSDHFNLNIAKANVKSFLKDVLCFSKNEKMFLSSFANGEYKPQLIFEDQRILENIKNHPMASWQIQKIQENLCAPIVENARIDDSRYTGKVCNITDNYFAQKHGSNKVIRHYFTNFESVEVSIDDNITVKYKDSKGEIIALKKEGEMEL